MNEAKKIKKRHIKHLILLVVGIIVTGIALFGGDTLLGGLCAFPGLIILIICLMLRNRMLEDSILLKQIKLTTCPKCGKNMGFEKQIKINGLSVYPNRADILGSSVSTEETGNYVLKNKNGKTTLSKEKENVYDFSRCTLGNIEFDCVCSNCGKHHSAKINGMLINEFPHYKYSTGDTLIKGSDITPEDKDILTKSIVNLSTYADKVCLLRPKIKKNLLLETTVSMFFAGKNR